MQLPTSLQCLTLEHIIDDPATVERYFAIDPITTGKCMPIALRNVLNEYAIPAGLPPMPIPDAETLLDIITNLWSVSDIYEIIHLPYLLVYRLSRSKLRGFNDTLGEALLEELPGVVGLLLFPPNKMWAATIPDKEDFVTAINNPELLDLLLLSKPSKVLISELVRMGVRPHPPFGKVARSSALERLRKYITTGE